MQSITLFILMMSLLDTACCLCRLSIGFLFVKRRVSSIARTKSRQEGESETFSVIVISNSPAASQADRKHANAARSYHLVINCFCLPGCPAGSCFVNDALTIIIMTWSNGTLQNADCRSKCSWLIPGAHRCNAFVLQSFAVAIDKCRRCRFMLALF